MFKSVTLSSRSLFVTGAEDGKVRVFCQPLLGQQGNADLVCKPVRVFEGHSSKSFHVKFSPLRDGYLASGSDDRSVYQSTLIASWGLDYASLFSD